MRRPQAGAERGVQVQALPARHAAPDQAALERGEPLLEVAHHPPAHQAIAGAHAVAEEIGAVAHGLEYPARMQWQPQPPG